MVGRTSTTQWNVMDDVAPLVSATVRQPALVPDSCIDAFAELGVCYLPGAFVDWVDPLRAGLERMMRTPQDFAFPNESAAEDEPGRFFDAYCNWQRVPEFLLYTLTSPAAAIAAQCMQSPTAQFFHEHVFAKESGTEKKTPWHHDLPYYCVDGRQTASVYVALDDTDEDAIVFDFRTLHGTTDVRIQSRRRAFSTRWLGEDVRYVERPGITSPPLGDLGVRVGEPMPEHLFPTLWHTPR